jgi:hypothetical protein
MRNLNLKLKKLWMKFRLLLVDITTEGVCHLERQKYQLGKKLIGYNKEQVELYLEELNQYYTDRIDEIKHKINDCL